jgi:hypothetical protein
MNQNTSTADNAVYDEPTLSVQSEEQLLVDGVPVIRAATGESTEDGEPLASIPRTPHSLPRSIQARDRLSGPSSLSLSAVAPMRKNFVPLKDKNKDNNKDNIGSDNNNDNKNVNGGDDDVCTLSPTDRYEERNDTPMVAIRVEDLIDRHWHGNNNDNDYDNDDDDDDAEVPPTPPHKVSVSPARMLLADATPPESPLEKTLDVNTPKVVVTMKRQPSDVVDPMTVGPLAPATPSEEEILPINNDNNKIDNAMEDIENAPTLEPDDVLSESEGQRKRALAAAVEAAALDDAPIAPPSHVPMSSPSVEPPLSNWSVQATIGETELEFSPIETQQPTQDDVFMRTDDVVPPPPPQPVHVTPARAVRLTRMPGRVQESSASSQPDAHVITASDVGSIDEEYVRLVAVPKRRMPEVRAIDGAAMSCDDGEPLTQQPPSSPSAQAVESRAKRPRVAPTPRSKRANVGEFKRPTTPTRASAAAAAAAAVESPPPPPRPSSPPPPPVQLTTVVSSIDSREALMLLDLRERFAAPESVSDERVRKVRAVGRTSGRGSSRSGVGVKLFKDLRFLLTGLVGDGVDDAVSDNVAAVIGAGGGSLIETVFGEASVAPKMLTRRGSEPSELPNTMLVAPRTLRTGKFFWALAAHVPCLHYNWILHSAAANKLLPLRDYLLPAAIDAARGERPSPLARLQPLSSRLALDGVRIEVHSTNSEFRRTWETVVRTAGAKVVSRLVTGGADRLDVVVTDPSPAILVVENTNAHNVPLVGVDWVIDCLIAGESVPPDATFHDWRAHVQ